MKQTIKNYINDSMPAILTGLLLLSFIVPMAAWSASTKKQVKKALATYVKAGDAQKVDKIESLTHKSFRVAFSMKGKKEVFTFSKEQVLENFRAKKWGGKKRQVKIRSISYVDNVATVSARLVQNDGAIFHGSYTFVNEGNGWMLIQDTVVLELKK